MRRQSLLVLTSLLGSAWVAAQTAPTADNDLKLEEVVVTAERREANLQDVPLAVSAFTPEEMERRQAFNVVDVVSNVPNLVGNNNIGQGTATTVFLRGIGSTESIVTLETALGFYIDDVYISRQGVNNLSLFDVERVEVLRGPQGTLYGRNTTGGAIKVITSRPQNENSGALELSYGQYNRWSAKATGNFAASENFYWRGSVFIEKGDGSADNLFTGKEVNDVDGFGARVAGRWVGSENVEVNFSADYYKSDQVGLYGSDIAGIVRPSTGDFHKVFSGTDTSNVGETYGASLTIDWQLNDNLSLQSITGFRNVYQKWNLDLTDQPVSIFLLYTINDTDSLSQELRLSGKSPGGLLDYTIGAFYYDEGNYSFIGDEINLDFGMGVRVPLPFFARDYDVDVKSYAAFAEATLNFTEKLKMTVGARYTSDDKDLDIVAFLGGTPGHARVGGILNYDSASLNVSGGTNGMGIPTDLSFSRFSPKIGFQYRFNESVNAYFNFSDGWKSGGWSARTNAPNEFVVFDPEKVKSYELGIKTTLWGERARLNYTAYYYDYEDFFVSATGQNGNFIVFTGDPEFYGVEFEALIRASERLDLFAATGWQDGKYRGIDFSIPDPNRVVGEKPQRIPEWSLKTGGTYTLPLDNGNSMRFTLDYQFLKDHFTNLQNSTLAKSGNIEVWNAAVGYEFGDGKYNLSLACKNCFDNDYISQSLDFAGLGFVTIYPGPRQFFALNFKTKF